jgi:hypothetical protein
MRACTPTLCATSAAEKEPTLRLLRSSQVPALRTAAAYAIAIGALPEHVPEFACR